METEEQRQKRLALKAYQKAGFYSPSAGFMPDDILEKAWLTAPEEIIESLPRVDNAGWANADIEYVSLYGFLGKNAGSDIGQQVWNASKIMGVKSIKKEHEHSGSEIKYRHYPKAWLEMWFRDFDAQLSMEVYNKAVAKEALNQINKNNK